MELFAKIVNSWKPFLAKNEATVKIIRYNKEFVKNHVRYITMVHCIRLLDINNIISSILCHSLLKIKFGPEQKSPHLLVVENLHRDTK